jgi:hypothetical protein
VLRDAPARPRRRTAAAHHEAAARGHQQEGFRIAAQGAEEPVTGLRIGVTI